MVGDTGNWHLFDWWNSASWLGFAVTFTLIDPVPQSFRAAYHGFGLVSFVQGLCTIALTLTAQQCVSSIWEYPNCSILIKWLALWYGQEVLMLQRKWCIKHFWIFLHSQAKTTPELYYLSLVLSLTCILSTGRPPPHVLQSLWSRHIVPAVIIMHILQNWCLCFFSAFFLVKGGFWVKTNRLPRPCQRGNNG